MSAHEINPVDQRVGSRIRQRRRQLGFTQAFVAEQLGLTFQQVQKYEVGANRISASKLYKVAEVLNTPVSWFFETADAPDAMDEGQQPVRRPSPSVDKDIVAVWRQVPVESRKAVLDILRATYDDGPSTRLQ